MKHTEKRFYHVKRKVFDRENKHSTTTGNSDTEDSLLCVARSRYAAEQIEHAMNEREGQMQPIRVDLEKAYKAGQRYERKRRNK